MGKHYRRLCNYHSDNKAILLQRIKDNFFASPQRMLPQSRGFRYIKTGPDRKKTYVVKEMLSLIKLRCLELCQSQTFVPILFHRN